MGGISPAWCSTIPVRDFPRVCMCEIVMVELMKVFCLIFEKNCSTYHVFVTNERPKGIQVDVVDIVFEVRDGVGSHSPPHFVGMKFSGTKITYSYFCTFQNVSK